MVSISPVEAIVPEVQNVDVWNSGNETILNLTIYHTPVASLHHVDRIEVDVEGSVTSFPVDQSPTTFNPILDKSQELHQQEFELIVR